MRPNKLPLLEGLAALQSPGSRIRLSKQRKFHHASSCSVKGGCLRLKPSAFARPCLYSSAVLQSSPAWRPRYQVCSFSTENSDPLALDDDPKKQKQWLLNDDLDPHIRACLADAESNSQDPAQPSEKQRDTGFSVCFLGTGAGRPSPLHSNAATALRMGSSIYLFDAGEGVQLQFMRSRLRLGDVKKIFSKFSMVQGWLGVLICVFLWFSALMPKLHFQHRL